MSDESTEKPDYPETLGTALVNDVLQDVMAQQFTDRLNHGDPADNYSDGNSKRFAAGAKAALNAYRKGRPNIGQTHVDLVIAQAYKAASLPEDGDYYALYERVVAIAAYAADWAEDLAARGWRK